VTRILLVGAGAVGGRAARQLVDTTGVEQVLVADADRARAEHVVRLMGDTARVVTWSVDAPLPPGVDAVAVALPAGPEHRALARAAIGAGVSMASCCDDPTVVADLLALDPSARRAGVVLAVGAGLAPGLSDVMASLAAEALDEVDEIHVARSGVAGPACSTQRHRAGRGRVEEWFDGAFTSAHRAGSGRVLVWFPEPVAGVDCYRVASGQARLLVKAFPKVDRVSFRAAARRRDRLAAPLPMLIRPEPEGGWGAMSVEVRGRRGRSHVVVVYGVVDRMAVATGAVLAVTTLAIARSPEAPPLRVDGGAHGLAGLADPKRLLADLARRGVHAAVYDGAPVG
jgi:Oxidoreductase family, NAD-binding Rossmann fold